MWWFLRKKSDSADMVIYTYGRESREQSGEISFDTRNGQFTVVKLADNDTEKGVKKLLPHLYRVIFKENRPNERQIAIG